MYVVPLLQGMFTAWLSWTSVKLVHRCHMPHRVADDFHGFLISARVSRQLHRQYIKTDASKMAALLNSTNLMQRREHGHHQTHCEEKQTCSAFCTKFPSYFSDISSAEIKHKRRNSSMTIRKEKDRSWHVISDTEFASGWSWYRAYFSSFDSFACKIYTRGK